LWWLVAGGLAVLPTGTASAGFVPISGPATGELGQAAILEGVYSPGSAWIPFGRTDGSGNAVDYTNGTLMALRVDDFGLGGVLNVKTGFAGSADDHRWTGGPVTAAARARYAAYCQKFGYEDDGLVTLFDVTGSGLAVTGSAVFAIDPLAVWTWGRSGTGKDWFSDPTQNSDQKDHLATYQITGLADSLKHWMLFWEDLDKLGDKDYNDLAVELTATAPEPAGILLTLVWMGVRRRRPA
jgi:hypothetical protein